MTNVNLWNTYWNQGISPNDYVNSLTEQVDEFMERYNSYNPQPITDPVVVTKVAVITEDWCGDSVNYVPVLFKVCQALPNIEVRVFKRDSFPELRDAHLHGGKAKIPIVVFMNDQLEELGRFIERPLSAARLLGSMMRGVDMEKITDEDKKNFKKIFVVEARQFQPEVEKIFADFLTAKSQS